MSEVTETHGRMSPADIGALRQAGEPRVSPDGTMIAFTVTDPDVAANRYTRRIWLVPAGSSTGGSAGARPLTGAGSEFAPRWSPDGTRLAFAATDADGKHPRVCVLPVAGAGERMTVCAASGAPAELEWSPDGQSLAFTARDPDPEQYGADGEQREADMPPRRITRVIYRLNGTGWTTDRHSRVFVVPADGSAPPRAVTSGPYDASGLTWSPDSASIAFSSGRSEDWDLELGADLWVVPADGSAAPDRVTKGGSSWFMPAWSPDGTRLACYFNPTPLESPRHRRVAVIDLASGAQRVLTAELDRTCAPFAVAIPPAWAGERLLFGVEDGGNVHLYLAAADGSSGPEPVASGDRWITEWHWSGGTLAFVAATPVCTGEVIARPLDPAAPEADAGEQALTSLTRAFSARLRLAMPERFLASSADGTQVECWAMPPAGAVSDTTGPGTRYPVLLNVHGGPFTQYGNRFTDDFQLQAAAGFGVLYCNPRGSSGYSEQWGRAIRGPECASDPGPGWGTVDFADVMACVDEACKRFGWADPERLGILGGSYGGYMTSWAIGHTDRFKAACSERACNNLLTMEHSADIAGFVRSYVGPDHLTDPDAYLRASPVTYVRDMTAPLLIVHSEQDLRCPISQAEELFVALRLLGREPVMYRFPAETHELTRSGAPRHRITRAELILDWFREHLANGPDGAPAG